jgi:8-oxo-dGTP diphosphatase
MRKKRYVLGFYFTPLGNCILIEKTRPKWQEGLVNGLGGKIKPGESIPDAMAREFREECDIVTAPEEWKLVTTITGTDYELNVLTATGTKYLRVDGLICEEGTVYNYSYPPENMEQTALWLYWLCRDKSLSGATITGIMP